MQPLLDEAIKKQLTALFSSLVDSVGVLFFTSREQNCEYCEETYRLISEVTQLSDRLTLKVIDIDGDMITAEEYGIQDAPVMIIGRQVGENFFDTGIRFFGIPAGNEFTSLIRAILMVSSGDSGLKPDTRAFLGELRRPLLLQVFVTPTCPYCPQAVVLAHQMAFESDWVSAEMIEALEFPEITDQYGVSGVPHTVINDGAGELIGAAAEEQLLAKIEQVIADES